MLNAVNTYNYIHLIIKEKMIYTFCVSYHRNEMTYSEHSLIEYNNIVFT